MNPRLNNLLKNPNFRNSIQGTQAVDTEFFDTKTIPSGGLGAPGAQASLIFFDGTTAADYTLTNFIGKQQLQANELFVILGLSVAPLALHVVEDGAGAANIGLIAGDVDKFVKRAALWVKFGVDDIPLTPIMSIGQTGGFQVEGGAPVTTVAAKYTMRSAASNGEPGVKRNLMFDNPVIWPGQSTLRCELWGATGAFSAAMPVRVGILGTWFRRTSREQTLNWS